MAFFERDFVMRQIQNLTQLLQQIIFKKKEQQYDEAKQQLQDAFQRLTKDHPKSFDQLSLKETVDLFTKENNFESELAIAVADLLVEEGDILQAQQFSKSQQSYAQALLLYKKSLQDQSSAIPIDIHDKIKTLEADSLAPSTVDNVDRTLQDT